MGAVVRRDAQGVLLFLVGSTLLKISINGTYVRYVKPGQLWLLVAAGCVLLGMSGVTLWDSFRGTVARRGAHAARTASAVETDHGHDHDHGQPWVAWLLLAPALALLLFSPPALGSFQASRNGTALAPPNSKSDFHPLPDGDPVRLSMLDYATRAVFDDSHSMAGRHITLSGFIISGKSGAPYLARMIISCCAADARPVKVGLAGNVPAGLRENEWIEVVGTYSGRVDHDPVNDEIIPYFQVDSAHDIPAPDRQYES
jgi:uncharacterized repeat protein (TIGR03943 family)